MKTFILFVKDSPESRKWKKEARKSDKPLYKMHGKEFRTRDEAESKLAEVSKLTSLEWEVLGGEPVVI